MTTNPPHFDPAAGVLAAVGIRLVDITPLIDGEPVACAAPSTASADNEWTIRWPLEFGPGRAFLLRIARLDGDFELSMALDEPDSGLLIDSIGVRMTALGVVRYLKNGYTSWDGSYFVERASAEATLESDARAFTGFGMTALIAGQGDCAVLGFLRHDRYQNRLRFSLADGATHIKFETLIDRVVHSGRIDAEAILLTAGDEVEETLRHWARRVAHASPLPPRLPSTRIAGWCSWYNLYSSISEPLLLEYLRACTRFRNRYKVPFDVFQIDDGFTPEMGDWLQWKPQFPRGIGPLLNEIRSAGFMPGLWIAPFMVGNRSQLYTDHPDWVVLERSTGEPLRPMQFYGEFRWHKRSEEYYILDITHPHAEAYIRNVFRVWRREWGCDYFKTDFMYFGSEYGPSDAKWHEEGLSRMQIWMRMAKMIREEIGAALWLGCGAPIWASVGLMDAMRIGRDVGVSWRGDHSAESLLRDQTSRNFANGILWQADPDCILLRDRFHCLTDTEVRSLLLFAGLSGGVLMTSDQLDEVPEERLQILASFAKDARPPPCDYPELGRTSLGDAMLVQRIKHSDGTTMLGVFNTGDKLAERLVSWKTIGCGADTPVQRHAGGSYTRSARGICASVPAHDTCLLVFKE
ncbi:MAG TPA: glycoside hydrolase family 36 protein [Steroidobacteraceae bacterium]